MNYAKIWLSICANGSVRFARYCGKMYSRHLFPYGGVPLSRDNVIMVSRDDVIMVQLLDHVAGFDLHHYRRTLAAF